MKLLLVFALLITAVAAAHAADNLGRLFFTPAQRAQLDTLRERHQRLGAAAEAHESPLPQTITVNGVVTSSDGKSTVWINNQPVSGDEAAAGVDLVHSGSGHVTVRLPESHREVKIKVGESLNPQTGDVTEGYEWSGSLVPPEATGSTVGASPMGKATNKSGPRPSAPPVRGHGTNDAGGTTK